jgi:competence protein ComEC
MNPYGSVPFFRIVIPLAIGIITYALWQIHFPFFLAVAGALLTPGLHWYLRRNVVRMFRFGYWIGLCLNVSLMLAGNQVAYYRAEINHPDHFTLARDNIEYAQVALLEPPVEKDKSYKALVSVHRVFAGGQPILTMGKAILYFAKDSLAAGLQYGDELLIRYSLKEVAAPLNPGEFNYRRYLWYQGVYATGYVNRNDWRRLDGWSGNRIQQMSFWLRDRSRRAFQQTISWTREEAVMEALVVGYRDGMAPEIQQAYANAGVVHVLAVSGLHVGILYLVLERLLFFMRKRSRWKRWQALIIVTIVWMFAFVTGLSGSVVRAATMFSLISVGKNWSRSANSFNIIAASAVLILMWKPFMLMDVGFQLSYAAVIGITAFVPHMNWWMTRETNVGDFVWRTTSMSLAAQAGTLPLTLFYFKQFPLLFLFANILVIPISGVLLIGGMAMALLQWTGKLAHVIGLVLQFICWFMNELIMLFSSLSFAVIHTGDVHWWQAALILLALVMLSQYFLSYRKSYFFMVLACLCFMVVTSEFIRFQNLQRDEATVFAFRQYSAIEVRAGDRSLLLADASLTGDAWRVKYLEQYHQRQGISSAQLVAWNLAPGDGTQFSGKHLFVRKPFLQIREFQLVRVLDLPEQEAPGNPVKVDAVLISGNPDISLSELLKFYRTNLIIFDGSNKPYRVRRWLKDAEKLGVRCHNVLTDGALTLRL